MRIYVSPMRITSPATLPNGTQNSAYSQTIQVTGGTAPYTFSLNCCTPGWLNLNSTTGVLSGTAGGPGYWSFPVVITDSTGAPLRKHYNLGVVGVPLNAPTINTTTIEDHTIGQYRNWTIGLSGGTPPYSWTVTSGSLPPGLSLQAPADLPPYWTNPGIMLAGTPTALGVYTFALRVADSSSPGPQTTARMFTVRISALSQDGLPNGTLGVPYSQKLRVVGGTQPYSYSIVRGALPNGLTMDNAGQVTGTPTETGRFWILPRVTDAAGNSLTTGINIRINGPSPAQVQIDQGSDLGDVSPNQSYSRTFTASGGTGPYTWILELGSTLPGTLVLSDTGTLSGTVPGTAGTHIFSVRATDSLGNYGVRTFRLNVTSLRFSGSDLLPYGNVNASYSATVTVTGATGAVSFSVRAGHALPLNLVLNTASGVISGTPLAAGNYFFDVVATDSGTGGTVTRSYTLVVYPQGMTPPLYIGTASDLGARAIGQVQAALIAGGGTGSYAWSLHSGKLPDGLALRTDKPASFPQEASAGVMGVATKAGTSHFSLTVTSGAESVTQAFTMSIHTLLIKDANLPDAFANVSYSYTFSNAGPEAVTWSVQPGTTLPPGLNLSSAGVLSGVPTTPATYTVSVSMTDGVNTNSRSFQLVVWAVRITTDGMLANATQNVAYPTLTFAAEGGTPPYMWSKSGGLPSGMNFADGVLSGTPTGAGTWNFSVTATDSQARFYTKQFSLTVVGAPPILPSITTAANLDDFSLGNWKRMQFDVSGGTAPYTWSVTNAPPGLSVRSGVSSDRSPSSAELWGTPTQLGTWNVTLTVTDSSSPANSVSRTYTVRVVALDFPRGDIIPYGTRGQPYSAYLRILGGTLPYTWAIVSGKLPKGLSLNPGTGMVTGTPLENTNSNVQFRITDNAALTFIRSFRFDIGGGTSTIRIDTGYDLGSITLSQSYSRTLNACCVPSYTWSVESGSSLPPGLDLSSTGTLYGTPTVTGTYSFLVRAADSTNAANYGTKEFVLNVTPLTVTSNTTLPWTNQGASYSSTIAYSGNTGTVTFGVTLGSLLPPGLTLNTSTGVISGTPTSAGVYSFNITLTDTAGNTWRTVGFNITIYAPGGAPPLFLPLGPALGPRMVGRIAYALAATGGSPPYTYSYAPGATPVAGVRVQTGPPLPTDFSSTATGGFMGIVTTPDVYTTTIRVTDSKSPTPQTFDRQVTLTVSPLVILSQAELPKVAVGSSYAFTFSAAGGSGFYTWSAPNWAKLPPDLTVSPAGLLSGIANKAGTYNFDVTVTDLSTLKSVTVNHKLEVTPFAITTPGVLPQGTANSAYSTTLSASGTGVTWSRTGGNLPSGLSLDANTGVISGMPTGAWYGSFTIQAKDNSTGKTVKKVFSLMIVSSPPQPLSISTGSPLSDTPVGSTYTVALTAMGGTPPYIWSLDGSSTLPAGLSLAGPGETIFQDGAPGFTYIAGRPTVVGTYNFTLRVTDSASPTPNSVTRAFTLNVTPISIDYSDLPIGGSTLIYNAAYTQPLLGLGGTGTYNWAAEGAMPPGLSLSAAGTVSGVPTNTGTISVPIRITQGSATHLRTVNFNISSGTAKTLSLDQGPDLGTASQGSLYSRTLNPSGSPLPTPNYVFSVVGALPPGCALQTGDALPSGVSAGSANLACTLFSAGTFTFTVRVQDAAGNFGVKTYTLRVTPNTIFTGGNNLANASVGVPYSQQLLAWGASQTWSLASGYALPPGMYLLSSGVLGGSPTVAGDYQFTLAVTDGSNLTVTRNFSLHVSTINITDPGLLPVHAISNAPFTYTFTATGGGSPRTWTRTSGSFPTGITLDSATGVLSGTTASPGNWTFILKVSDGSSDFSKRFTLVVRDPYPGLLTFPLASTQLPDVVVGQSYSVQINPGGGVPPYTWSGSALPPGLTLLSGSALPANYYPHVWVLAGAPTTAGVYNFTLEASDSAGNTIQRTFNLNVRAFNIAPVTLRNPVYGTPYAQALTAVGGTAPYSYSIISGLLPAGLTLSPSGLISGTPANTGNWTFTVQATDSVGATFARSFAFLATATTAKTIDITNAAAQSDRSAGVRLNTRLTAQTVDPATGISSDTGPYTWSLFSGTLPPGLSLVPGASLSEQDFPPNSTVLAGSPTTPGVYTFTLRASDSTLPTPNYGFKTFTMRVSPMQVWNAPWPDVRAGVPFSYSLMPAGGTPPHSFALAPFNYLPAGVSLSSSGVLSGSTSLTGSFGFSFTITEGGGATFTTGRTIRVLPVGKNPPLTLTSADGKTFGGGITDPSVGMNYISRSVFDALASSGVPPLTWGLVSGSLPPGMVLIPGDSLVSGNLTGTPTTPGPYSFTLRATDSAGQSLTGAYNMTVSSVGIAPYPLLPATVGTPYSVTVTPSGGTAPYSIQLRYDSSLPPGISLSSGVLSGTPTAPGRFSGVLLVTDSLGAKLNRAYHLYVDSALTPVAFLALSPGSLQLTYAQGETPPAAAINISSGSTPVSFTAGVSGIPGASLSVAGGITPRTTTLVLPGLGVGTYYGVIQVNSPQSPNTPQTVRVQVTVVTPPPCTYAISPATATIASGGGSGTVTITTNRSACAWTATVSDPTWITLTSPASGTGSGSVSYSISSNPSTLPRTGTIAVNGQTHTITQFGSTCSYTIDPTSASLTAAGGAGTITVNASLAECAWTATSNDLSMIQITSGASGTGSGAVSIAVAANATGLPRTGTVTVAGQTFIVNQAPAACIVSLSSGGAEMPASGGSGSVGVNIPAGCNYSTVPGPSWITVLSGGSGTGSGTLNYSVSSNSSTQTRSGSLLVGGQPFRINQAGVPCSFSLTNDNPVFPASGGTGSIGVTANGLNCDWSSASGSNWLTITSGATGIGNGTVYFTVGVNSLLSGRSGNITVAGQSATINQSGLVCTYSLRSSNGTMPATGGTSSVGVVTAGTCPWTATSNDPAWLVITSGGGSGSGDVVFTAQPNSSALERSGTLTVAGQTSTQTYTVTQAGAVCAYTLSHYSTSVASTGATGSFTFWSTTAGCTPSAVSYSGWIVPSTSFGGTSGTVSFTVAANPSGSPRSGVIQLGDQIFTITQTASTCAFSLNAYGAVYSNAGGSGEVLASGSALGCTPIVGKSEEITLGPLSGPVYNIWTQPYAVAPFNSFVTFIRLLYINISGQMFTVKQTSW